MEILGHSQLDITMNLYSHVMPSALREATDAIDRVLGSQERVRSDRCCHYCCQMALRQVQGPTQMLPDKAKEWS